MASFTAVDDRTVLESVTMHVGGRKRVHVAGLGGDKKLVSVTSTNTSITSATLVSLFDGPKGIWTVDLRSTAVGTVTIKASGAKDAAAVLTVTVQAKVALPAAETDAGMLVRLFLAEVRTPDVGGYSASDAKKSMQWMRVVLENRLAYKDPGVFGAKGAKALADIVRAPKQVEGFEGYPTLSKATAARIAAIVALVNDDGDARQAQYAAHLAVAVDVAGGAVPADPCPTKLYAWRTANSGSPGGSFAAYGQPLMGNQFYTLK